MKNEEERDGRNDGVDIAPKTLYERVEKASQNVWAGTL